MLLFFFFQLGSLVHELKVAAGKPNSSVSVDIIYPFYPTPTRHEALITYKPQDGELELEKGDVITVIRILRKDNNNKMNETRAFGLNGRTNIKGFYALKNVKTHFESVKFPGFE